MQPLNLRLAPPRSPFVKLGGLFMLARTIDKLRAELPGGELGEYHYSGFSQQLLEGLGITHDALAAVVAEAADDDAVVAWVHTNSDAAGYSALNDQMVGRRLDDTNRERLTKKYPVALEKPQISRLFDLIIADDEAAFA